MPERLDRDAVMGLVGRWPRELRGEALGLREFVLEVAPEAAEAVKFGSLCYFKPNRPYGAIGGNVCMIGTRKGELLLGFIHGAALPDPEGLLEGKGKAARHVVIRSERDPARESLRKLIRASVAYDPAEGA